MAAEASPGLSRLTLDDPSFEKLLAAAWVIQCLHDQLHNRQAARAETVVEPANTQKAIVTASSGLQLAMKPVVPPPPTVREVKNQPEVRSNLPATEETLAELVEAQQAIETGSLDLDAAIRRVLTLSLKLTRAEGAAVWLFAKEEFAYRAGAGTASNSEKLRLAVLSSLASAWRGNGRPIDGVAEPSAAKRSWVADVGGATTSLLVAPIYHGLEVAGALAGFTERSDSFSGNDTTTVRLMSGLLSHALRKAAAVEVKPVELKTVEVKQNGRPNDAVGVQLTKPLPIVSAKPADDSEPLHVAPLFDVRNVFNGLRDALSCYRPTFRVNLTLRALRAVAIATPILLLSIVAALLFFETWRHESFHSAQAISRPSTPAEQAIVRDTSTTTPTRTTQSVSEAPKGPENTQPRQPMPVPVASLEVSHKRATDPGTLSALQQLSPYEISGLRRQAKYGDDSAAFTLGMAYELGRHVSQSCAEAARWVTASAESGNAAAEYNLGLRYRDGDGVSGDRTESEKWLRKAAAHRIPQAKLALKMLASR
jgi:Sel1 repeat